MGSATNAIPEADPWFGYKWQHRKTGGVYTILHFGVEEATLRPVVVYRDDNADAIWTRPCAEFFDGRFKALPQASATSGTTPA